MKFSYITLDVASQPCPFCVDGNSRSSVRALDIEVVVIAVVQLEKKVETCRQNSFVP